MTPTAIDEVLVAGPAEGLVGLLDASDVVLDDGKPLPLLWHWVYLLERPARGDLGPDGHPLGGLASPPPGRRRMWAGGRVRAPRPLVLGRRATRSSEVVERREREGRSGPLTFVTIRHQISQGGEVAVEEWQDIVYRLPAAGPASHPARPVPDPGDDISPGLSHAGSDRYSPPAPDTVTLFRMSALTYNSHRIHYDRDYVRDMEGYADLVVHGPLQALYMAEAVRRLVPDGIGGLTSGSYRMTSPLLLGAGLRLKVERRLDGADVTISTGSGVVTSSGAFAWPGPRPA